MPENNPPRPNVVSMFGHGLQRWTSVVTSLDQCFVFAKIHDSHNQSVGYLIDMFSAGVADGGSMYL